MNPEDGGWTVFQRRITDRDWDEYKDGFGESLGNDCINYID